MEREGGEASEIFQSNPVQLTYIDITGITARILFSSFIIISGRSESSVVSLLCIWVGPCQDPPEAYLGMMPYCHGAIVWRRSAAPAFLREALVAYHGILNPNNKAPK